MAFERVLGKTGLAASAVGFGGASIVDASEEEGVRILNGVLDAGVTLIDTAQVYGKSEELIGKAISHRRREFTLVSKCGHHEVLADGSWRSRKISMGDVDAALVKLKTDVIDVMLLHSYDLEPLQRGEAVGVLVAAKKAGKLRAVGYSGDNENAVAAARMEGIEVVETSISFVDQANVRGVLAVARERGVGVMVKRSIGNAVWQWAGMEKSPNAHYQEYLERLNAMGISPEKVGVAGMSWGEMTLRFTLRLEGVSAALVGTAKLERVRQNAEWARKGALPAEVVERILGAFLRAEKASGKEWKGCN